MLKKTHFTLYFVHLIFSLLVDCVGSSHCFHVWAHHAFLPLQFTHANVASGSINLHETNYIGKRLDNYTVF